MTQVVLIGAGHTHAHVLDRWRRAPLPGAQLTCVSPFPVAAYSGMLPGVLAGEYRPSEMTIDLEGLCAAAGARLVVATATGLDRGRRQVRCDGHPPVPYDVLSVGVGSEPSTAGVHIGEGAAVVPVKPMQTFLERLGAAVTRHDRTRPLRLAVVGGGAAGVELALCAPRFVARTCAPLDVRCMLVTEGGLLDGSRPATVARAAAALDRRGVQVRDESRVTGVDRGGLSLAEGAALPADVILWVTGAAAPPFLGATGLPTDARGFLRTEASLRTVAADPVFAVGDSGAIDGARVPKAGVHAVRQGPVLWDNLRRTLARRPLTRYTPQRSFLTLLNTGDGSAIGEWRSWSFEGRGAAILKSWIDRRFVRRFETRR